MIQHPELMDLAERVVASAQARGADEVSVQLSRGTHDTIQRRDREIEQATEATTQGLVLSVTKDQRFTSNATNDLRPEALERFIERCVQLTSFLEPDPYRRQPDPELCGRGATEEHLDQDDPAWGRRTPPQRADLAQALEEAILAKAPEQLVSASAFVADGRSEEVVVMTNGFADSTAGAWFSLGGDITLAEGDKRPEAYSGFAARHLADLPTVDTIADDVAERARQRLGSRAAPSGSYPMLLENRVAGQLLGILAGPLTGGALHHGRSFLAGKLGEPIASAALSIDDDPTLPRGLGSRPWVGDCLIAKPRTMVSDGVLRDYNIGVYYGRKLDLPPTGTKTNWIVRPGTRSLTEMAADLDKAVLVTGFLGGNSNPSTGDFSFGIRGLLLERGEVVQSLSEMNVGGNVLRLLAQLAEVGSDVWGWSSIRSPTLRFDDVQFSGK